MTKSKGGKTARPLQQPRIRPSAAATATGPACPTLALSAMSVSAAIDVDHPLPPGAPLTFLTDGGGGGDEGLF